MNPRPKVGAVGRSLSILNPRGQADFDGVSFPVEVLGSVIDAGRPVVMTGFDPWALFVREVVSETTVPSAPAPEPVAVTNHGTQDSPDPPPAELSGFQLTNGSSLEARTIVEVLAPIQAHLQIQRINQATQTATVMIALTPEALWIQDAWQTRSIPLYPLDVEFRPHDNELVLTVGSDGLAEKLTLTFSRPAIGEQWYREVKAQQEQLSPNVLQEVRYQPEGVTLVQQTSSVTHVILESVEFTGPTAREANRGLQLRAGMRGGDAVMHVHRLKVPREGPTALSVSGVAIRVENAEDRKRLRFTWYDEELRRLFRHTLLLLILQALTLLSCVALSSSTPGLNTPTGLSPSQTLASAALWIGLLHGWPLVLLVLMRMLRWPQLLRGAGLAVLAATTGRSLVVWVAHLLAGGSLTILVDPILWIFAIVGLVLCIRAWQVAEDAPAILPPESGTVAKTRTAWAGGLLTVTILYALGLLGVVGYARYQASAHLMTPGVDPRREQEALLALNEGAEQANRGDLVAAEQSMQRSLRLWEELTRSGSAPVIYRANLAMTLSNLGWIRLQQGRQEEAETFYARAVALADKVGDDPSLNNEFKQTMAGARETLSELRSGKSSKALEEKDQAGDRIYEEAQVKSSKGELEAERLFQEAIALWEEVLPQATNRTYRNDAHIRLATAYLRLGTFQHNLGKWNEAEATLNKAIEHGEKAVNLNPDRPLPRHNLEVARQTLDGLREQVLQGEISKLIREERYDAALGRYLKGIQEQENSLRTSSDRDAATRRLTYRLDRCAWFLAHCPDGRVRDTKAAIKHASRATLLQPEWGDYWYTLALVQYRNGDSRESLETLEKLKAKEGVLDATGWYLVAMNRHQLGQKEEAQGALRRAAEWVSEQRRKAEGNALLRYQFELTWPYIESLKQEAERLIEGKEAVKQGVG